MTYMQKDFYIGQSVMAKNAIVKQQDYNPSTK